MHSPLADCPPNLTVSLVRSSSAHRALPYQVRQRSQDLVRLFQRRAIAVANLDRHAYCLARSCERFSGRRYSLLRGLLIVFEDAPCSRGYPRAMALTGGAATGPLLVLATERVIATALGVAGGGLPSCRRRHAGSRSCGANGALSREFGTHYLSLG